eukprot:15076538-Alexandrium_andersonii.AAC.1
MILSWLAERGLTISGPGGPARRSPRAGNWSRLDWVAVSPQASHSHDITALWHADLSDHAGLVVIPAA